MEMNGQMFLKQTATVICLMVPHQIISPSKVFTKAATMAEISGLSFAMRDACYEPKLPAWRGIRDCQKVSRQSLENVYQESKRLREFRVRYLAFLEGDPSQRPHSHRGHKVTLMGWHRMFSRCSHLLPASLWTSARMLRKRLL